MLTAWVNFQGPFTLHSVAAGALGLKGSKLRLITPPNSGGSFGIKATTYVYVVLVGLAARKLGVPVRWTEDRLEHLAGSSASTARITDLEAAFTSDGELLALRYDVLEDVGAYIRAPEPASLYRMHGALTGAYRARHVAVRNRVVLTNRCPTGLNRGFGGPQLYMALERTMAIAAGKLGLDPAELARRNLIGADEFPYRTPSGGLYDSGDYAGCLEDALELVDYDERREEQREARADGRLYGIGVACCVEPSISNMGYVTLALTAEERAAGLPKSGNAEGATVAISPLGGITVLIGTTPQGQGHATVAAQVAAEALGVKPEEIEVLTAVDTSTSAWTVVVRELLVAVLGRRRRGRPSRRAEARGEDRSDPRARGRRIDVAAPRRRHRALAYRRRCRRGWSPVCTRPRSAPRRISTHRTRTTASPHPPPTASSPTSRSSRSTGRPVR